MDRAQLKFLLSSGPSRMLDVRKARGDGRLEPLFAITHLNNAILFKQAPAELGQDDDVLPSIATMIYLPFDRRRPEEGGESFFFSRTNLTKVLELTLGDKGPTPEQLLKDLELLKVLDSIPTFSPFLMKDALERAHLSIPEGYFVIGERDSATIKQSMRARLRPLVATAFKTDQKSVSNTSIERLVHKLWELDDLEELAPLILAFRLSLEEAPDIFYCWLGIAFFENEYIRLQTRLKKLAEWISKNPRPKEILPREALDHYQHSVTQVRRLLQLHWRQSLSILRQYADTYEELVGPKSSAGPFTDFLRNARDHFWTLGGALGRLEQSIEVWDLVCGRTNYERPTYERGTELFHMLAQVNAIGASPDERSALAVA